MSMFDVPGYSDSNSRAREAFAKAGAFVLRFGKFKDRAVDEIAQSDDGLKYLDWLRGELHERCQTWQVPVREALDTYLSDPSIAKELQELLK